MVKTTTRSNAVTYKLGFQLEQWKLGNTLTAWMQSTPGSPISQWIPSPFREGRGIFQPNWMIINSWIHYTHFAQPVEWNIRSLQQGKHGFFGDLQSMTEACSLYQGADKLASQMEKALGKNTPKDGDRTNTHKRRRKGSPNDTSNDGKSNKQPKKTHSTSKKKGKEDTCPHCGNVHKKPWNDCWTLEIVPKTTTSQAGLRGIS
jgi:hypothetical protein